MKKPDLLLSVVTERLSSLFGRQVTLSGSFAEGGGCISHALTLETSEGRFFLKWNHTAPRDMFLREAESLHELRKAVHPHLIIPEVIAAEEGGETPGFLVLEWLEASGGREDEKLGRGLALLHQYRGNRFGFYNDNYCGSTKQLNGWSDNWISFYSNRRILPLVKALADNHSFSASETRIMEELTARLPRLLPSESVPVLIHGDLWGGNYIITPGGPALIDPAAYYADREMEAGIMTLFGGFSHRFWTAYQEVNPMQHGWRERNPLYQLFHLLNHALLFGGGYGRQSLNIARQFL